MCAEREVQQHPRGKPGDAGRQRAQAQQLMSSCVWTQSEHSQWITVAELTASESSVDRRFRLSFWWHLHCTCNVMHSVASPAVGQVPPS